MDVITGAMNGALTLYVYGDAQYKLTVLQDRIDDAERRMSSMEAKYLALSTTLLKYNTIADNYCNGYVS